MEVVDLLSTGLLALQVAFVLVLFLQLIGGLDDLFVDILFIALLVARRLGLASPHHGVTLEAMAAKPEQHFALMFPAWQEAEVIRHALMNTLRGIDYKNFHVFVGTYVNDLDTQREVEEVMRHHDNVTKIVVPHPGPTCKADCLNWIIKAIFQHQEREGTTFAGVILHDAEDVIDPLSLRLFNCVMPEFDLVQIPIISLKRPWHSFTGGHYMDEFAEAHCKEIHVREWFAGIVPGAGVGTCYSMRALEASAKVEGGDAFATDSLTEDYDFSFRVRDLGLKQTFLQFPISQQVIHRTLWRRKPKATVRNEFITTRELFPDAFWASVRQKTRWVIGISLQGWAKFGWRGDWRTRYLYFRDRKSLLMQQVLVLGYLVTIGLASTLIFAAADHAVIAPLFSDDSALWYVFYVNVALLANRLVQRHFWTCRVYGISQLPLVLPRYFLANVVNYLAVTRAMLRFSKYLRTGERIGWDKTAHRYPGEEVLVAYRRRLGDVLLARGAVTGAEIEAGLAAQAANGRPLGMALVDIGVLDEDALIDVLCDHLRLERAGNLDPRRVHRDLLRRIPERCAKAFSIFPQEEKGDGRLAVACVMVPDTERRREIEAEIGVGVEFRLSTRAEIAFALRHGYGRLWTTDPYAFQEPVEPRIPIRYRPIGELLVDLGALKHDALTQALPEAARRGDRLGEYLIAEGIIESSQLTEALTRQRLYEGEPALLDMARLSAHPAGRPVKEVLDAAD